MSTERERLIVYDELRKMHSILKAIPEREDEWEQNALDAVHSVLYLAEHAFSCEHNDTKNGMPFVGWTRVRFPKGEKHK